MLHRRGRVVTAALAALGAAALALVPMLAGATEGSFIGSLHRIDTVASTVPANGDVNPYGVAVVPRTTGHLVQGDVLVSNFNNSGNLQGTGTTIVQVAPNGAVSTFAALDPTALPGACPGGIGLTTALVALRSGWVIVGSLPTTDGTAATAQAGCLVVLHSTGRPVETISGGQINGPWDMTALDLGGFADLFVTNVLNGTVAANGTVVNRGTVLRIGLAVPDDGMPRVISQTVIGSRFPERTDPAALVIGPTGVGLSANDTLYVADSLGNRVAAIPDAVERDESAGSGRTVSQGGALNDPLGLALAPNGDILTVNGDDGFIVETTPEGTQVAKRLLDNTGSPPGSGALFGLAVGANQRGVFFVDDASNTLNVLH